jgi:hypothetical protein
MHASGPDPSLSAPTTFTATPFISINSELEYSWGPNVMSAIASVIESKVTKKQGWIMLRSLREVTNVTRDM